MVAACESLLQLVCRLKMQTLLYDEQRTIQYVKDKTVPLQDRVRENNQEINALEAETREALAVLESHLSRSKVRREHSD